MFLKHSTAFHVRFRGVVLNRFWLSAIIFIIGAAVFHYGYSIADDRTLSMVSGFAGFTLIAIASIVIKPWWVK